MYYNDYNRPPEEQDIIETYGYRVSEPIPEPPRKSKGLAAKFVAVGLCCALIGGLAGGVGGWALGGMRGTTTIYQSDRAPTVVNIANVKDRNLLTVPEVYATNVNSTSLATNAFGQNYNVTMVQLAAAFSSLINGGYYYQPHLVKRILDDKGNTVQTIETTPLKQTISKQTSDKIKSYLYKTVSEGTGKSAKVEGYSMGGKTGTAEKGNREDDKYVVSFIGFAPVEEPQVLVYVVIDEANVPEDEQSSALATALAKKIFAEILPYINIFQDEAVVTADDGTAQEGNEPSAGPQQEGLPDGIPNAMPEGGNGTSQEPEDLAGRIGPETETP